MNSPYMGKFKITQAYKGSTHDGLDLVGLDSKEIHATVSGVVEYADWETSSNHSQGFGQYVKIIDDKTGYGFYYGHLSEIKVKPGQRVKVTDVIGIEGSTGYSTGSHCHYCCRKNGRGTHVDISALSGIPNEEGKVFDDGYTGTSSEKKNDTDGKKIEVSVDGKKIFEGVI